MSKILVAIVVSLATGFAAAALFLRDTGGPPVAPGGHAIVEPTTPTDARLRALEAAVAEERNARQLLEDELAFLIEEIDRLDKRDSAPMEHGTGEGRIARTPPEIRRQLREARGAEARKSALIDAGFSADRADWILKRESALELELMQARFEARRAGTPVDPFDPAMNPNALLRAELGDTEYERYLEANNRPTAVGVSRILESSPGQVAGLRPGDQIVRYDGNRVFDVMDLTAQTMQGAPGESVVVDVLRDDVQMQFVLPRGPIGIRANRFSWRR